MTETYSLSIASNQKRVIAFILDDLVIAFLLFIIFYGQLLEIASMFPSVISEESIEIFQNEMNRFSMNNLLFIVLLKVSYHTLFIWQSGRTLGKYLMRIRVVDKDSGYNLTLVRSFFRASLRIVSEGFFYLGFVLAYFLPLKQTLHDKLSESVVIDG